MDAVLIAVAITSILASFAVSARTFRSPTRSALGRAVVGAVGSSGSRVKSICSAAAAPIVAALARPTHCLHGGRAA